MSTPTNIESILKKIAGLRALAANAGTQAEAEAAASRAAAIIAEYQIEEAQLETTTPTTEEIEEGDDLHTYTGKNVESWRAMLATGLAKGQGCYSFYHSPSQRGQVCRQRISGRASDIAIVRYLFAWLCYEIDRLAEREDGRAARNAFRLGAVSGYLRAMRQAQEAAFSSHQSGTTSTSLVLADRTALSKELFTKGAGMKLGARGRTALTDGDAYRRGQVAGAAIQPRSGLNAGTPVRMLGR